MSGAAELASPEADYAQLRAGLERAVRKVAPAWLGDHREDLVQQAMEKVMRRVRGGSEVNTAYLYRVAHSCVVDEIRRLRRRPEAGLDEAPEPAARVGADPEVRASGRQISLAVVDCLGRLATSRKRAVTLYLQGHTVPETGRLLGFSSKKAENLVYRGLGDMRGCLSRKGIAP